MGLFVGGFFGNREQSLTSVLHQSYIQYTLGKNNFIAYNSLTSVNLYQLL